MNNLNFDSEKELKLILNEKSFKKIFIVCGKKSFKNSGAKKLINKLIKSQEVFIFQKIKPYPDFMELEKTMVKKV